MRSEHVFVHGHRFGSRRWQQFLLYLPCDNYRDNLSAYKIELVKWILTYCQYYGPQS